MCSAEMFWLAQQAQHRQLIVEIGSWKGRSTRALADHTTGCVITVDPMTGASVCQGQPEVDEFGAEHIARQFNEKLGDLIGAGRVIPIRMRSEEAIDFLRGLTGFVDMVFIDGDHAYECVFRDIVLYTPLLRKGGLLCGHDFARRFPGVKMAVQQLLPECTHPAGSIWAWTLPVTGERALVHK